MDYSAIITTLASLTTEERAIAREIYWKMYQENITHGRHHETVRSAVSGAVITISTAIIGIITFDRVIGPEDLPLTLALVVLGLFAAGFSLKQYERTQLHTLRSRAYRNAMDALLPGTSKGSVHALKKIADQEAESKSPILFHARLHRWWAALNLMISLVGVVLSGFSFLAIFKAVTASFP